MKILLFGDYVSNGYCVLGYYQRGFKALGHEVLFFHMSSDGSDKSTSNNLQALQNTYPYHIAQRIIRRINHHFLGGTKTSGISFGSDSTYKDWLGKAKLALFCSTISFIFIARFSFTSINLSHSEESTKH